MSKRNQGELVSDVQRVAYYIGADIARQIESDQARTKWEVGWRVVDGK